MDDVDRMYRHLVRTIRATAPQLLTQPFAVSDLYTTILPYRLHRRELGVETNQDYEVTMLELLSGARGYLTVDDRMRQALGASVRSTNPDPALIREFASARVALAPDALRQLDGEGAGPVGERRLRAGIDGRDMRDADTVPVETVTAAGGTPAAAPVRTSEAPRAGGTSASAPAAPARRPSRPITVAAAGAVMRVFASSLPPGRQISFCPHCGQDLTVQHCPACGSELEHGWKFCVTCGRGVSPA